MVTILGRGDRPGCFLGQRQQGIPLGTREAVAAMFAPEKRNENKDQPKAAKNRDRYDGHKRG